MNTRRTRRLIPALTLGILAAACDRPTPVAPELLAPDAAVEARSGISDRFPVEFTMWNSCTGEENILVTGDIVVIRSYHEDRGGGFHWLSNYAFHGSAVGLDTGNEYVYNEIHNMKENGDLPFDGLFDETGAYYFTMSFIGTLISRGPQPNELFQWDIRFKRDSTGAVTLNELRYEILCRG